MARLPYTRSVFINCPFDADYRDLLHALVFAIHDCGFVARTALEVQDVGEIRLHKIIGLIGASKFGFHDLSRVELDGANNLPRFNMPLELGLFLGAYHYGDRKQLSKVCLVADAERLRYQKFISDIAGQDPVEHKNSPAELIRVTRNWLRTHTRDRIPGDVTLAARFELFREDLPKVVERAGLSLDTLIYVDLASIVVDWIKAHPLNAKTTTRS